MDIQHPLSGWSVRASSAPKMPLIVVASTSSSMSQIFSNVESLLETTCKARGFQVLFLPKFHCELNFIEKCWGYSKRTYRQYPISSKESDLEHNVLMALDSMLLVSMHWFATRSQCFMDGYWWGLNGKQATWASKKSQGHRVLPDTIAGD